MFWLLNSITLLLTLFSKFTNILTGKIFNNYILKHQYNTALYQSKINIKNDVNSELISISPGGFKGFYMLGITSYIKKNYDLSNYIFSGASAGAWNALLMAYKGDIDFFIDNVLEIKNDLSKKNITLYEVEEILKQKILNFTNNDDYDFSKLYIGVSTFHNCKLVVNIFSNFENLEDALDCCIASSHIPLVTGKVLKKYNNIYVFDGGFCNYPYVTNIEPKLHITPHLWNKTHKKSIYDITSYTTLFSKGKYDIYKLFMDGYNDSEKNKHILDNIFINKKI